VLRNDSARSSPLKGVREDTGEQQEQDCGFSTTTFTIPACWEPAADAAEVPAAEPATMPASPRHRRSTSVLC
jgi:hypothetical protein